MSEYNMSHTGAELDDAINKFISGYIKPSGNTSIKTNGTHDVRAFENAVVDVPNFEIASSSVSPSSDVTSIYFSTPFKPRVVFIGCGKATTTGSNTVITSFSKGDSGTMELGGVSGASTMISGSGNLSAWGGCNIYLTQNADGSWTSECRHYNNGLKYKNRTTYYWFAMGDG